MKQAEIFFEDKKIVEIKEHFLFTEIVFQNGDFSTFEDCNTFDNICDLLQEEEKEKAEEEKEIFAFGQYYY